MSDCLRKNISVQQPVYCQDSSGNVLPDTAVYEWMAIRSNGPNVLHDNKFCGENRFLDDVNIDGDLNVTGEITGNVVVGDINIYQIECTELQDNNFYPVNTNIPTIGVAPWEIAGLTNQISTIVIDNDNSGASVSFHGLIRFEQPTSCYVQLINATTKTFDLVKESPTCLVPEYRFTMAPNTVQINPGEGIQCYYTHTLNRWVLMSHL